MKILVTPVRSVLHELIQHMPGYLQLHRIVIERECLVVPHLIVNVVDVESHIHKDVIYETSEYSHAHHREGHILLDVQLQWLLVAPMLDKDHCVVTRAPLL